MATHRLQSYKKKRPDTQQDKKNWSSRPPQKKKERIARTRQGGGTAISVTGLAKTWSHLRFPKKGIRNNIRSTGRRDGLHTVKKTDEYATDEGEGKRPPDGTGQEKKIYKAKTSEGTPHSRKLAGGNAGKLKTTRERIKTT